MQLTYQGTIEIKNNTLTLNDTLALKDRNIPRNYSISRKNEFNDGKIIYYVCGSNSYCIGGNEYAGEDYYSGTIEVQGDNIAIVLQLDCCEE